MDILVARIDAPRLGNIDIKFFSQPTLDALQLGLFISRTESWGSPFRAYIISSGETISLTLTQKVAPTLLRLQISCERSDWQLSSISQICEHFSSSISSVEDLHIETSEPSIVPDDMDDEQWLRLTRGFDNTKDFRLVGKLVTDILHALHPADEGHTIVHPSLRNLHVHQPGNVPLRVESFVAKRQASGHPVQVHPIIPSSRLVFTLPEDRFKLLFAQYANTVGLRLYDRDFVIDNRTVNPWALHRAVFARNGFGSVCPRSLLSYFSIYIRPGYCK